MWAKLKLIVGIFSCCSIIGWQRLSTRSQIFAQNVWQSIPTRSSSSRRITFPIKFPAPSEIFAAGDTHTARDDQSGSMELTARVGWWLAHWIRTWLGFDRAEERRRGAEQEEVEGCNKITVPSSQFTQVLCVVVWELGQKLHGSRSSVCLSPSLS